MNMNDYEDFKVSTKVLKGFKKRMNSLRLAMAKAPSYGSELCSRSFASMVLITGLDYLEACFEANQAIERGEDIKHTCGKEEEEEDVFPRLNEVELFPIEEASKKLAVPVSILEKSLEEGSCKSGIKINGKWFLDVQNRCSLEEAASITGLTKQRIIKGLKEHELSSYEHEGISLFTDEVLKWAENIKGKVCSACGH